jgi:hypothetical protein
MVDRWLLAEIERGFTPELIVDFGPGEHGWTTRELVASLEPNLTQSKVVCIENDPERCKNLRAESRGVFDVIEGGFDFDLKDVGFLRAMNVFRQYPVEQTEAGYTCLREHLSVGGLLICGTCDRTGEIGSFWRFSSTGDRRLVVFTTGSRGFAPRQFRDFLPRDIRRTGGPKHPFLSILPAWEDAWASTRRNLGPSEAFDVSIHELQRRGLSELVAPGIALF